MKHAAEPGGTPCLGDTHESETCNEEAKRNLGRSSEGKWATRDEYVFLWEGKVLSRDFFLAIIYIYIYGIIISIGLPNIERFFKYLYSRFVLLVTMS